MMYKLYHATAFAAAQRILSDGFAADMDIWLANTPWKIGVKGEALIEVVIDFNEEEMSFLPESTDFHHVILTGSFVNNNASSRRLVPSDEKNRLVEEFGPPGSWPEHR